MNNPQESMNHNKDNDYNTAVGYKSLNSNNGNNASGNTAIGFQSMMDHVDNNNQTADQGNTALGYQSLMTCVIGRSNVAVGSRAMYDASENSFYNVAMGNEAMEHGAHLRDIAIGYQSNESNINGKTEDNIAIMSSDPTKWQVTWAQIEVEVEKLKVELPLREVRIERNHRLTDTDWVVARATETSTPVPYEWRQYRQALRDITNTATSPDDVVWPTKPS